MLKCVPNNPCQNGGTCIENDRLDIGYACMCIKGYTGLHCEQGMTILQCQICVQFTFPYNRTLFCYYYYYYSHYTFVIICWNKKLKGPAHTIYFTISFYIVN